MQKVFLILAAMLSAFAFTSCSSDDDSTVSLAESAVTLKVDENKQLKASGNVKKWGSENEFIASVSIRGLVTANHVGETQVMANGSNGSAICKITVQPKYTYYIEPLCKEGITKSDVKKYEKRNLRSESTDGLFYNGENTLVTAVAYQFDSNGYLKYVLLMIPHHNSSVLAQQLINFLLERYNPVADIDGVYTFIDANSVKTANKIVYMEVAPQGYYNYISVTYAINTNK